MRMWMIDPKLMCDKHLVAEHGEIHKFRHTFVKHCLIKGRIEPIVQIEPTSMKHRHDELAEEMLKRGMKHKSPYHQPSLSYLPKTHRKAKVDIQYNLQDLSKRCPECAKRIGIRLFVKRMFV